MSNTLAKVGKGAAVTRLPRGAIRRQLEIRKRTLNGAEEGRVESRL